MSKANDSGNFYGIGAVARLTGVSVHTLRVWERRHNAVTVTRSEGGRRLYTAEDVDRLTLLKRLVDRGETIGRVANLTLLQLEARLENFERHADLRLDDETGRRRRIAIFGEFPGIDFDEAMLNAEIVIRDSRLERFRADVRDANPDVLVVELPMVTPDTRRLVSDLRRDSGAGYVIVVFGLGRRTDVQLLGDETEFVMRAPVSPDEIGAAISRPGSVEGRPESESKQRAPRAATTAAHRLGEIPARRYSRHQLGRLAVVQSSVDCECPTHLAELVERLSTFEEYSADCENRNREDAALHAFLHATTAQARSLIEDALDRVVEAEGLDPGPR